MLSHTVVSGGKLCIWYIVCKYFRCKYLQMFFLGLETIFNHPQARFGASKEQLEHFKSDLINNAESESTIYSFLRDFCRLYK